MASSENKQAALKCTLSIDTLSTEIRNLFNADSVTIYYMKIKEEVYFNEINGPVILIYNATTNALNFKMLPTSHYQRFENFEQIENDLKNEGIMVAQSIIDKCKTTEFNDLIIEFIKLDDNGKPTYRFICHYKELLK